MGWARLVIINSLPSFQPSFPLTMVVWFLLFHIHFVAFLVNASSDWAVIVNSRQWSYGYGYILCAIIRHLLSGGRSLLWYSCMQTSKEFGEKAEDSMSKFYLTLPLLLHYSSESSTMRVNMSLVLNETFYGRRTQALKSKTKRRQIVQWDGTRNAASRIDFTNQRTFDIPDVQESDMRHCHFIDVCYTLEVCIFSFFYAYC